MAPQRELTQYRTIQWQTHRDPDVELITALEAVMAWHRGERSGTMDGRLNAARWLLSRYDAPLSIQLDTE